jgi:hypothetical protein
MRLSDNPFVQRMGDLAIYRYNDGFLHLVAGHDSDLFLPSFAHALFFRLREILVLHDKFFGSSTTVRLRRLGRLILIVGLGRLTLELNFPLHGSSSCDVLAKYTNLGQSLRLSTR